MKVAVTLTFIAVTSLLNGSDAFSLFGNSDCSVSTWAEWEGPLAFGSYQRIRTVLAPQRGRGKPCPTLVDTKTGPKPSVRQTAKTLSNNFLKRTSSLKTRDLLIIVDSSGSIGSTNFTKARPNLARLLSLLCPAPDPFRSSSVVYQQAAIINFSGTAVEVADFKHTSPTANLKNEIKKLRYYGGSTCTGEAFIKAKKLFQAGASKGVRSSPHVQKEILIITDGKSNCGANAIAMATDLKNSVFSPNNDKVKIYGLMIGGFSSAGQQEVQKYVSTPVGNHLFAIPGFDKLEDLVNIVEQNAAPCVPINWR